MAISLKHEVMGCRCLTFVYNTKYEGAVDPGSLQVQNQPGKVCLARLAVTIPYFQRQAENYCSCHLLSHLGRTSLHP